jgi:hypothetical protein
VTRRPAGALLALAFALGAASCSSSDTDPGTQPQPNPASEGPPAAVSGRAFVFGPASGTLHGAVITTAESPELSAVVDDGGAFQMMVPSGREWSFVLRQPGFQDVQSATLLVPEAGLEQVGFQVPTDSVFKLLSSVIHVEPDPERCQIVTTVSAAGTTPYGGPGVGEPDATVSIDPPLPPESGPIYFQYISESLILPDLTLQATTIDGGVIFANVPVGEYRLTAQKPGKSFTSVKLRCRAGLLVNAAPPRGLQGL